MPPQKIGIVILNYNGWQDTICCAESVLSGNELPDWLIIADNASSDNSCRQLQQWARGELDHLLPGLGVPAPVAKPLAVDPGSAGSSCSILQLPKNSGYAAGNNAAIRLLLDRGADAVWILNNDTVVHPDALRHMRERLFSRSRPGLCGSTVCYADQSLIQCRGGGSTNRWTSLSRLNGQYLPLPRVGDTSATEVEQGLDFIYGASVMASRQFLQEVGLMDEDFFLYCEEQDWAWRARGRFDLAYAPDAVVWHKEGASTGFSHSSFNALRALRLVKSRLLLARKHCPWTIPTVLAGFAWAAIRKFARLPLRIPGKAPQGLRKR